MARIDDTGRPVCPDGIPTPTYEGDFTPGMTFAYVFETPRIFWNDRIAFQWISTKNGGYFFSIQTGKRYMKVESCWKASQEAEHGKTVQER